MKPNWRDVRDGLPTEEGMYWVRWDGIGVERVPYSPSKEFQKLWLEQGVTHWMPLSDWPLPPAPEQDVDWPAAPRPKDRDDFRRFYEGEWEVGDE